jgi:tetratricopeptide (TPR) repeat protein
MLEMKRDDDQAIRYYLRALELRPDYAIAHFNLSQALVRKGKLDEAMFEVGKIKNAQPNGVTYMRAYLYALAGRQSEALVLLSQLSKLDAKNVDPYSCVALYAALGDKKSAFEWLEKLDLDRFNKGRLKLDPRLDSLREDQRFKDFLTRKQIAFPN